MDERATPHVLSPASSADAKPRLAGFLATSLEYDPAAATKYGYLFRALEGRYNILDVYDVSLRGLNRLWNGLLTFHPQKRMWKERYFKNLYAFEERSRNACRIMRKAHNRFDIAMQVGVLFDATGGSAPVVIYTDYTARLSAEDPRRFRSPLKGEKLARWLDYEGRAFCRAVHIFTRSNFVREDIVAHYSVPSERVSVVGGGVNFDSLPSQPPRGQKKEVVLLFIGSEFQRKGGDTLLRAFALVRQIFPQTRLRFLTRDPIPSGFPLDGVEIVPYAWDRGQIDRLYGEADMLVLPSRHETWGDVILEAAAYGLPTIGTRGQAMEEVIVDGKTGLLVAADNVEGLADAILLLLKDADLRRRMGDAARARAESLFTWDHVAERMAAVLDSVFIKYCLGTEQYRKTNMEVV